MPSLFPALKIPRVSLSAPGVKVKFSVKTRVQFDRSAMTRNWARFNGDPLKRTGAYIRTVARRSIRQVKHQRPSPPGTPPRSRDAPEHPMRRIFFDTLPHRANVIVGPMGLGALHPVTELQEFGGFKKNPTRRISATSKKRAIERLSGRGKGSRKMRLRTLSGKQMRQNRHIKQWYKDRSGGKKQQEWQGLGAGSGKSGDDRVTPLKSFNLGGASRYPERPYMRRALKISLTKIPGMWKGALSGPASRGVKGHMSNFLV